MSDLIEAMARITDADIEAISDNDPVWKVAERVVFENHGVGNAAVIIQRYYIAGIKAGLEAAADWLRGISDPGATFQDRRLAYQLAASQFAEEIAALDPAEVVKGKP